MCGYPALVTSNSTFLLLENPEWWGGGAAAFYPGTREAEVGGSEFEASLVY